MVAVARLDVNATVLANAQRAADKLRQSIMVEGPAAGKRFALKTDARDILALLRLVDVVSGQGLPAPRGTADEGELTPNQAAEILKMSRPSVMRLIEKGVLHPRMVHSRHKLARDEVEALAERQTRERRKAMANLTALSEEYDF